MGIEEFSSKEHTRVVEAESRYGGFYINAYNVTLLLSNLMSWPLDDDAEMFMRFYSQVKKFHTLSFISTIRMHRIQAKLNLRYFLESTVHAAFSLANPDSNLYFDYANKRLRSAKNVTGKANKWLHANYRPASDFIKDLKEAVNEQTAHSNVSSSGHNFDFSMAERPEIHTSFFDFDDDPLVKFDLWICAKAGLEATNLILNVRNRYGHFLQKPDFEEIRGYMAHNDKLHAELICKKA